MRVPNDLNGHAVALFLAKYCQDMRISHAMIHNPDARVRRLEKPGQPAPGLVRPDDQPVGDLRKGRPGRVAVVVEQDFQPGYDIRIVGEYQEIARVLETLSREIQRCHESRAIVADDVFRVVLHHGIFIRVHIGAETLQ